MRAAVAGLCVVVASASLHAQPGKFPPDSLVNVQVIPKGTSPIQLIGQMRNFAFGLGVRCQF